MPSLSREEVVAHVLELSMGQVGGTLATLNAEDSTPYPTFVLFHMLENCCIVFGSTAGAQHSQDMDATPEVAFLIDNRDVINTNWHEFDRVIVEGHAVRVERGDRRYDDYVAKIEAKNPLATYFTDGGHLYCIHPRRLILRRALEPERHVVDFEMSE